LEEEKVEEIEASF